MKTLKLSLLFTFSIICILSFTSCGGSDGPGGVDCNDAVAVNSELSDELEAVNDAVTAYVNDQSEANCDALKDAYQDYIDELKGLQDCANDAGVGPEFAASIADAEQSIDDLIC